MYYKLSCAIDSTNLSLQWKTAQTLCGITQQFINIHSGN